MIIGKDRELALRLLERYGNDVVTLDPKDCIVDMLDQIDEMEKQKEQNLPVFNRHLKTLEEQIDIRDKEIKGLKEYIEYNIPTRQDMDRKCRELKDLHKKNNRQADEITILRDQKKISRDIRCKDFKALEKLNDENKELKAQHIELKVQMSDRLNGKIEEIQALTDIISDRDKCIKTFKVNRYAPTIAIDVENLPVFKELVQDHTDLTETCGDLMEEKEKLEKELTMAYASIRAGALEREGLEEDKDELINTNKKIGTELFLHKLFGDRP